MGIWMKVFIFFVVGIAIIFIYAQDCVSQHTVKNKETVLIKTFEPKRAFEFIKQNKRNPDFVVLDIRTSREFQDGHIAGSRKARQIKNLLHILQDRKTERRRDRDNDPKGF
jgi:hypothetical protein